MHKMLDVFCPEQELLMSINTFYCIYDEKGFIYYGRQVNDKVCGNYQNAGLY